MGSEEWKTQLADRRTWLHLFGPPESPVALAALDPGTVAICRAIRDVLSGSPLRVFVVGPPGSGKSLLLAALVSEAEERAIPVRTLSVGGDLAGVIRDLARGEVGLLAVDRVDQLPEGARAAVFDHRSRCAAGIVATAEQLSAARLASLADDIDDIDVVAIIPPLEQRPADVLAISGLLWPEICGEDSDLPANCLEDAVESLCAGPYPNGVTSLRSCLEQLADALIASGELQGGTFRRPVDGHDVGAAVLASYRAGYSAPQLSAQKAVIVVEGPTDVTYLTGAAAVAEQAWGWKLLDGCQLEPAGDDRLGGAKSVWQRLIVLMAASAECIGLFDNDDVGRREYKTARGQSLHVELLPADFDRLRLADEQRTLEIEDLLSLGVLERFYDTHHDLEPEEIRWRSGAGRVVPRGQDKEWVAEWVTKEMRIEDCERLIYVLCALRKRIGLPVDRPDLDQWRRELSSENPEPVQTILERLIRR